MFWEIVKDESGRTKEVSPPSPSRTPPGEESTQEGEMIFNDDAKSQLMDSQQCWSDGESFICETHRTPTKIKGNPICPPAP